MDGLHVDVDVDVGTGVSVCADAHIEDNGREMTTNMAVKEDMPSNVTTFSRMEKIAKKGVRIKYNSLRISQVMGTHQE